jgi:hypothetical protein
MTLFTQVVVALFMLLLTLSVQCAGVALLVEWLKRVIVPEIQRFGPGRSAILVLQSTIAIVLLHGLVILLWGFFYRSQCFSSWELAFYFSASSYSTVGYGDLILPSNWRLLGPLEGIIGVLMCGISVSLLFAVVTRLVDGEARTQTTKASRA